MSKKRVLFITQEMLPYLEETEIAKTARNLPQGIQQKGKEIRTFMPKFGCINERRNQLHEVIRLSGMNLIINDNDHPLIIKVASIQAARIQVYFIDNDDYFGRKAGLSDKSGAEFEDNDERAIFYCRGVLETVKKLGWAPDIVHCHGWMTSLVPMYIKRAFSEEPIFENTKVITSLYKSGFEGKLSDDYAFKAVLDGVDIEDTEAVKEANHENLQKYAANWSDAIIIGSNNLDQDLLDYVDKMGKPTLKEFDENNFVEEFDAFYDTILEEENVSAE
ncbi:MAG: starch synthase [Saprospiraceae bacterium]|jgi:starch synthase